MLEIRKIYENDPLLNAISRPVEIDTLPGELTLNEIQLSVNVIKIPGTNIYCLAQDLAAMLSVLLAGQEIIVPNDPFIKNWLLVNICKKSHDQRKLKLDPEKRHITEQIIEKITHPKET